MKKKTYYKKGVRKLRMDYENETGMRLSSQEIARHIFGSTDRLREENFTTYSKAIESYEFGNYRHRVDERLLYNYGFLGDMTYEQLKSVYKDLKYAMKKMDYPAKNFVDLRTIPVQDREAVLREGMQSFYNTYFEYGAITREFTAQYEENRIATSGMAQAFRDSMKELQGNPSWSDPHSVDTYTESMRIINGMGLTPEELEMVIYDSLSYSSNSQGMREHYLYYMREGEDFPGFTSDEIMQLAVDLENHLTGSKVKRVRTPKVK